MITPETVLTWWDVVDRLGLGGFLLALIIAVCIFIYKTTPKALATWNKWSDAEEANNKALEEILDYVRNSKKD